MAPMLLTVSFQTIVLAIIQILILGAGGFWLVKRRTIDESGLNMLTRMLISFFLPIFMFYQFTHNFNFEDFSFWWMFPLIGLAIVAVGLLVGRIVLLFCPWIKSRREFLALVIFQNSGYIPLILVTTLLSGEQAQRLYVYIFLVLIGFNVMMWSFGVWLLAKNKGEGLSLKNLNNPPLVAMLSSLLIIFFGWHKLIPQTILVPVQLFSQCTLPMAMIVIGGNLALIKLEKIQLGSIALVVLTKLLLLPLVALGIIFAFKPDELIGLLILIEAIVPSAMTLSIIARYYQVEEKIINQGIFYSHIFSIITMPVFLMIYVNLTR